MLSPENPLAAHATTYTDHDRELRHDLYPDFDLDLGDDHDPEIYLDPEFDLELDLNFGSDLEFDLGKLL